MLPVIDARTLFVASAVVFFGLVISVALAWRELRTMKGPDRFAKSYALFLVGLLLFALQDRLPPVLSVLPANVLVVLGAAFVLEGTKLIFGLRPGRRVTLWTVAAAAASFGYFTLVRYDTDARTILSSAFLAALLGTAGWTSWHRRPRSGSRALETVTAIALTACALLFWARAVAIGTGLVGGEMLDASPWMAVPPLLCTLCAVVWTTTLLANTSRRLTSVVRSQNALLANLLAVARAAGDGSSLDATLDKVLETVRTVTGATGSSLLLLDENGRFSKGLFSQSDRVLVVGRPEAESLLEKGLAGWVVRHGTTAVVVDVETDPRWHRLPSQEAAIRSALCASISSGSHLAGVITLVHAQPGHFGQEERHLVESTSAQIALALRSAQIADSRLRASRRQAVLNQVLEISARHADTEELAAEAADAIARSSTWPRVSLALPGEDGHFRLHGRSGERTDLRPRLDEGPLGEAFQSGVTWRGEAASAEAAGRGREDGPWKRLVVPLRYLGRTLGVASFEGPASEAFDEEHVALAEALAEAVSLGLGKAELARAREELTRMMVHDLRGPLAGVMGALELLGTAPALDEADRKLVGAAERNARRQLKLVEGILEIARLEEGALPVCRQDVAVDSVVGEALRTLAPAAEARGLALASEVPAGLPAVRVDPELISRVLENLVGNAVKFSAPRAGPILVSARPNGMAVEVRVRDSGPGIEETLRPRLFEKFAVGTQPGRGSGLGLPFCRLAVEAHGGQMWLEHPGPGAVFAFTLPLVGAPDA
jgi:signal transduction histidine kinase